MRGVNYEEIYATVCQCSYAFFKAWTCSDGHSDGQVFRKHFLCFCYLTCNGQISMNMPIPPSFANAMARHDSVTVSIGPETRGTSMEIFCVMFVDRAMHL